MEKRLRIQVVIFIVLLVLVGLVFFFSYTQDCAGDTACFNARAASCKKVEASFWSENNRFSYGVLGKKKVMGENGCVVRVQMVELDPSAKENLKKALEGKGMICFLPDPLLKEKQITEIEDLNDYCSGPLKEVLLQISLERLYEIVVKNIGPLSLEFTKSLSQLNTTNLEASS
ncbi:MAG: hypothetical protein WC595_04525 [Candidatus Nanoarchaeia archaeon]